MEAIDLNAPTEWYRVLLYGDPGTGKTTMGASAPRPLYLLTERNGAPHVAKAVARTGRPIAGALFIGSFRDFRRVIKALITYDHEAGGNLVIPAEQKGAPPVYDGPYPGSIVIDHLADVIRLCTDEIRAQVKAKGGDVKLDREGLPREADGYWRVLIERMTGLVTSFRDLPLHVVFLAHAKYEKESKGRNQPAIIKTRPNVPTQELQRLITGSVNVIGVTFRRIDGGRPRWGVATMTSDLVVSKPFPPLKATETTDLSDWFARLDADRGGVELQGTILDAADYDEHPDRLEDPADLEGEAERKRERLEQIARDFNPEDDGSDDAGAEAHFAATGDDEPAGDW